MKNYLNFETDIKKLEEDLDQLKDPFKQGGLMAAIDHLSK